MMMEYIEINPLSNLFFLINNTIKMSMFLDKIKKSRAVSSALGAPSQLCYLYRVGDKSVADEISPLAGLFQDYKEKGDIHGAVFSLIHDILKSSMFDSLKSPSTGMAIVLNTMSDTANKEAGKRVVYRFRDTLGKLPTTIIRPIFRMLEILTASKDVVSSTWEDVANRFAFTIQKPTSENYSITVGQMDMVAHMAHCVNWELLFPDGGKEFRTALVTCDSFKDNVLLDKISPVDDQKIKTLLENFKKLTYDQILRLYNFCHLMDSTELDDLMFSSTFLLTTSLVKANVTSNWIQRRVQALSQVRNRLDNLTQLITVDTIRTTRQLLINTTMTTKQIGIIKSIQHIYNSKRYENRSIRMGN